MLRDLSPWGSFSRVWGDSWEDPERGRGWTGPWPRGPCSDVPASVLPLLRVERHSHAGEPHNLHPSAPPSGPKRNLPLHSSSPGIRTTRLLFCFLLLRYFYLGFLESISSGSAVKSLLALEATEGRALTLLRIPLRHGVNTPGLAAQKIAALGLTKTRSHLPFSALYAFPSASLSLFLFALVTSELHGNSVRLGKVRTPGPDG